MPMKKGSIKFELVGTVLMTESPKGGIVCGLLLWALSRLVAGSPHRQPWVRRRRVVVLRLLTRTRVAGLRRVASLLGRGVAGLRGIVGRLGRVARCGERMAPTWKSKVTVSRRNLQENLVRQGLFWNCLQLNTTFCDSYLVRNQIRNASLFILFCWYRYRYIHEPWKHEIFAADLGTMK
jgi:hypothetical protein